MKEVKEVLHETAHHFDSAEQEFDACKTGMWIFLVTEIMLFGGLFVGYTVFRNWNPELWKLASEYILDWKLGALNTLVLIISSWTMVMGVYSAQTSNLKALKRYLLLTILLAGAFMVVKGFEYTAKFDHHAFPVAADYSESKTLVIERGFTLHSDQETDPVKRAELKKIEDIFNKDTQGNTKNLNVFMGFYFTMTGIHGFHILIGMGLLAWLYVRACRGEFHKQYFTPIEMVGLYWHIVDLIWIFLFPLFYLVG